MQGPRVNPQQVRWQDIADAAIQSSQFGSRQEQDMQIANMKDSIARDTLGERISQNEIANNFARQRIGLARAAANRASKAMTPAQKEIARRKNTLWDIKHGKTKDQRSFTGSGKSAIPSYLSTSGAMDEDSLLRLQNADATLKASGIPFAERERTITGMAEGTSSFNPLNWRDYALKENLFY